VSANGHELTGHRSPCELLPIICHCSVCSELLYEGLQDRPTHCTSPNRSPHPKSKDYSSTRKRSRACPISGTVALSDGLNKPCPLCFRVFCPGCTVAANLWNRDVAFTNFSHNRSHLSKSSNNFLL
jgi:hypothetical protein